MRNPANRMGVHPGDTAPPARCPECRLFQYDCLCGLLPRVETRTRVVLVLHQLEDHKTSNTGRLAHRCLPNSEIVFRGDPVLLFPHPDARPLEAWRDHPRPLTLIVPDGTWRQGQRVRHRTPGLQSVPCAAISREAPSNYRLRTASDPRRLATLEAIAEALGVLEGDEPRRALLKIFDVMVQRSLSARAGGRVRL